MKIKLIFITLLFGTLFLSSFGCSDKSTQEDSTNDLSYTEDQTWFRQKRGQSIDIKQESPRHSWRPSTWEERISWFIKFVRSGDRKVFLYVEYDLIDGYKINLAKKDNEKKNDRLDYKNKTNDYNTELRSKSRTNENWRDGVIWTIYKKAQKANTTIAKWLTKDDPVIRKNVIRSVISGLFNKDPRVRLIAVNLLRSLGPDISMDNEKHDIKRASILETVTTYRICKPSNPKKIKKTIPMYTYVYIGDRDPVSKKPVETVYYAYHQPYKEIKKLDLFVTRAVWINNVKNDINSLRLINKKDFLALTTQIENESLDDIPMKSPNFKVFAESEIKPIIVGMLENKTESIRDECLSFIKRFFNYKSTSLETKKLIKKALREARRQYLIIGPAIKGHSSGNIELKSNKKDSGK